MLLLKKTKEIGEATQRVIAKLNPQGVFLVLLSLILSLVSTIFTVAAYYKDYDDPRNTLASRGITWSEERFFEAIRTGDTETTELFLKGKMSPHISSDDRQLPIFIAKNRSNPVEVLDLLIKYGFDVNHPFEHISAIGPRQNYAIYWAALNLNTPLIEGLIKRGAIVDVKLSTTGHLGMWTETTPIEAAMLHATRDKSANADKAVQLLKNASHNN